MTAKAIDIVAFWGLFDLHNLYAATQRCPFGCPAHLHRNYLWAIPDLVAHLNDIHRWTREAIADHLDTLDLDLRVT